jgi:hypothetical protein
MMTAMTVELSGLEHVGRAALPVERLEQLGRIALGGDAKDGPALISADFRPDRYPTSTIATERLTHCRLGYADGQTARIFVKEIRDVVHWPLLPVVPEHLRAAFVADFPWRLEVVVFTTGFGCRLPEGLRLPEVYAIEEIEPGRAAIWMEDVTPLAGAIWTLDRYAHAARLLGRLAARRQPASVQPLGGADSRLVGPNDSIRMVMGGRIDNVFRPAIEGAELWQHPTVAAALDRTGDRSVIDELRSWLSSGHELMADTASLPMTYAHGDASPQNLLVPANDADTFVVIDPGFHSQLPVGHDLGQLLVGLCHAGEMDPDELASVHAVILPAYVAGLADEAMPVDPADVERGYLSGLLLRSGFTAIPLEGLGAPTSEESIALWTHRLRLTRKIFDLLDPLRAL